MTQKSNFFLFSKNVKDPKQQVVVDFLALEIQGLFG